MTDPTWAGPLNALQSGKSVKISGLARPLILHDTRVVLSVADRTTNLLTHGMTQKLSARATEQAARCMRGNDDDKQLRAELYAGRQVCPVLVHRKCSSLCCELLSLFWADADFWAGVRFRFVNRRHNWNSLKLTGPTRKLFLLFRGRSWGHLEDVISSHFRSQCTWTFILIAV